MFSSNRQPGLAPATWRRPALLLVLLRTVTMPGALTGNPAPTFVVFPLDNRTGSPALSWIGEGSSLSIGEQLLQPGVKVVSRARRTELIAQAGLPLHTSLSRGSMISVAREASADYALFGWYEGNPERLQFHVQILALREMKLLPWILADGPLEALAEIENHLAFSLLSQTGLTGSHGRDSYRARMRGISNTAFAHYVHALMIRTPQGKMRLLEKALEEAPRFPAARILAGRLSFEEEDCAAARRHLEPIKADRHPEAFFLLGNCHLREGDPQQAAASYRIAAEHGSSPELFNNLGVAQANRGEMMRAVQSLLQALRLNPGAATVRGNLAIVRFMEGNRDAAETLLQQQLQADEADARTNHLLALVLGPEHPEFSERMNRAGDPEPSQPLTKLLQILHTWTETPASSRVR